jgi:hypothetical protein
MRIFKHNKLAPLPTLPNSGGLPNRLSRLKPTGPGSWEARDFVENEFLITFTFTIFY